MSQPRYLTKSRFKLAMECPTKLYYTNKPEYANQKIDDPFLRHLADGGFQVGKLAQCYFPGGVEIDTLEYDEALRRTDELLQNDEVTIFEAAFRHENFFIRADVVVKRGNKLELIEVKAKSCDFSNEDACWNKNGTISAPWLPYIQDVAFQKYVVEHATGMEVTAYLMMTDKTETCPTDGLNQKFRLTTSDQIQNPKSKIQNGSDGVVLTRPRRSVTVSPDITDTDLNPPILRKVCVDQSCDKVFGRRSQDAKARASARAISELGVTEGQVDGSQDAEARALARAISEHGANEVSEFEQSLLRLADAYARDEKILTHPSTTCGTCEFRHGEHDTHLKSGYRECWTAALGWKDEDFEEHTVLDLWNCRSKDELITAGKIKLSALTLDDIALKGKPKKDPPPGFSTTERQWMQISKAVSKDPTPHIHADHLKREMDTWDFPLHFIDFETCAPAIPFKRGRRPYEGVAFQFSHHTVDADGRVEHRGEFLNAVPGAFPNYDLVRELKQQLESDTGSIFRYHSHENSYLCAIREQMLRDPEAPHDKAELIAFIETISQPRNPKEHPEDTWQPGPRNMVDLCEMTRRYYYHPATKGSISLKYVLPAVLSTSEFLQDKYSKPIYGADGGVMSLNFKDHKWVVFDADESRQQNSPPYEGGVAAASADGVVLSTGEPRHVAKGVPVDPYRLLPKLFAGESQRDYEIIFEQDRISDGGAAMTAYGKLQFQEMAEGERTSIGSALKKYCELDTLAMVMIYETWMTEITA
jgi:hypothetical protein